MGRPKTRKTPVPVTGDVPALAAAPVPVAELLPLEQDRDPNPTSLSPRSLVQQTRTFFDTIGRDGVIHMLEVLGSDDPKSEESRLVALLQDPQYADTPLHLVARRAGIPLSKLKEHFVSYQMTEGTLRAYNHLPKIMEDTAIAATEREIECRSCTGTGIVIHPEDQESVPCRACDGLGKQLILPDPAARALMFDTAGLTKKGAGIVINNNNAQFASPTSFEDLMRESSRMIDVTPRKDPD